MPLLLYKVSRRYKRDYLHGTIDTLLYIMFCIINTMKKQTLLYYVCTYDTKKVPIWTWPPYSIICSYVPVYHVLGSNIYV